MVVACFLTLEILPLPPLLARTLHGCASGVQHGAASHRIPVFFESLITQLCGNTGCLLSHKGWMEAWGVSWAWPGCFLVCDLQKQSLALSWDFLGPVGLD